MRQQPLDWASKVAPCPLAILPACSGQPVGPCAAQQRLSCVSSLESTACPTYTGGRRRWCSQTTWCATQRARCARCALRWASSSSRRQVVAERSWPCPNARTCGASMCAFVGTSCHHCLASSCLLGRSATLACCSRWLQMLSWRAGPKPYDGVWAPWWYAGTHKSTGKRAVFCLLGLVTGTHVPAGECLHAQALHPSHRHCLSHGHANYSAVPRLQALRRHHSS